ncbi:hypothetical protein AVEN_157159-1 [Araneus ventricosus]|uniref:Uncharacterized protein n=1 Tax=Araneus ventricosus TaxID=182803 RepID=A0A4Y2KPH5_ARAVE|nr:hypothetical protein AVEN_157159-1 [Araneus ventricosus]
MLLEKGYWKHQQYNRLHTKISLLCGGPRKISKGPTGDNLRLSENKVPLHITTSTARIIRVNLEFTVRIGFSTLFLDIDLPSPIAVLSCAVRFIVLS